MAHLLRKWTPWVEVIETDANPKVRETENGLFLPIAGGGTEPLVKRSEFLGHTHNFVAQAAVSPTSCPVNTVPVTAPTVGSSVTFPGTAALQAK